MFYRLQSPQELRPDSLAALGPPPVPADNPMSDAKIELGKMLFFDPILSGNYGMPCSACHLPEAGLGRSGPDQLRLSRHHALAQQPDHRELGLLLKAVLGRGVEIA